MLTRRKLIKTGTALGMATAFSALNATAQTPVPAAVTDAHLGDPQQAFDALFEGSREEGAFTVYDFSANGEAVYWVNWDENGASQLIEIDFSALPDNGLAYTLDEAGQSRFIRDDAQMNFGAEFIHLHGADRPDFYLAEYHSPSLATDTGRSGNVLVMDQVDGRDPLDPEPHVIISRTHVSMEAFEVVPITPTGNKPGVLDATDVWEAEYGDWISTATLKSLSTPPVPGLWAFGSSETSITPEVEFTMEEGTTWLADMLPAEAELQTTYWIPHTPPSPLGYRVHVWLHPEAGHIVSVLYVMNGEEAGTVSNISISALESAGS